MIIITFKFATPLTNTLIGIITSTFNLHDDDDDDDDDDGDDDDDDDDEDDDE